ncbi:MAG TPA: hypothetical protein VKT77_23480 [Chthonomonadaceae bacterium]|nr:hypothetical protein [Chthonomonadaceae bacterium]
MTTSAINRLGLTCFALIAGLTAVGVPLRCLPIAIEAAAASAGAGFLLGAALAAVTRTRKPLAIYAWLAVAALTLWPLLRPWPAADSFDLTLWRGAPDIFNNYFDFLRGGAYLLAMPYPFARFGRHAPDPVP